MYCCVTHLPNLHYLCGFTGSAAALLVAPRAPSFLPMAAIVRRPHEEVQGTRIVVAHKSPIVAAAEWLAARRRKSTPFVVGIEPESITAATRDRLPPR